MVDWKSTAEQLKDALAFEKLLYCVFGLYVWEIFMTSFFEWSLITRQRKFTWPLVSFYFLSRYCMLFALIGLIISINVTSKIDCGALYRFNSWTGNMATLCASTSLMLRTIAISARKWIVMVPLLTLCLGHWALLYHGVIIVQAQWDPVQNECVVNSTNNTFLDINLFYTMCFDLVILAFTATALLKSSNRSNLWHLLFKDGLVYWAITFSVNAIPAVLNILNLNTTMNIIATVPAACVATIASCRAVVRLHEYAQADVYVHTTSGGGPKSGPAGGALNNVYKSRSTVKRYSVARPEIQITTDHITMEEFGPVGHSPYSAGSSTVKSKDIFDDASVREDNYRVYDGKSESFMSV